jgi:hypothetical protein
VHSTAVGRTYVAPAKPDFVSGFAVQLPPLASKLIVTGAVATEDPPPEIVSVPMLERAPLVKRKTVTEPVPLIANTPVAVPPASVTRQATTELEVQAVPPTVTEPVALTSETYEDTLIMVLRNVNVSPTAPVSVDGEIV